MEQELSRKRSWWQMRKLFLDLKSDDGDKKDIISSLPDDIIKIILGKLCFPDAITTSFLSRHWRYKWRCLTDLIVTFEDSFSLDSKILDKIYHYMLLHNGDIRIFYVCIFNMDVSNELVSWMDRLVDAHVQTLGLKFTMDHILLPSVFSCSHLKALYLKHCVVELPEAFDGFKSLTTLELGRVTISDMELIRLIESCPLIKDLTIKERTTPKFLDINAPNLLFLVIQNIGFKYLNLNQTPKIEIVEISYIRSFYLNFNDVLHNLASIEDLKLSGGKLMYLMIDDKIPVFTKLTRLYLEWNLHNMEDYENVFKILKKSPALEKLHINCRGDDYDSYDISNTTIMNFWKEIGIISFKPYYLKVLVMSKIGGTIPELLFIKSVLANASFLTTILLTRFYVDELDYDEEENDLLISEIMSFPRVSLKIELRILKGVDEHYNDVSGFHSDIDVDSNADSYIDDDSDDDSYIDDDSDAGSE